MNRVQQLETSNKYCGPAALSIITGKTVDECSVVIGLVLNKTPDKIKGVHIKDLILAASRLRTVLTKEPISEYSLFMTASMLVNKPGTYLIVLQTHYVVIEVDNLKTINLCDNHTKEPINLANSARLSQKVIEVFRCEVKQQPLFVRSEFKIGISDSGSDKRLQFVRQFIYDNSEDNYEHFLTSIVVDSDEIKSMINQLEEMIKK